MECTAREPFSEDEAGAIYVFSDFTCEEMCADSDIAQIVLSSSICRPSPPLFRQTTSS